MRLKKTTKRHMLKHKHQFTIYGFSNFTEYQPTANREENLHICILHSKNIMQPLQPVQSNWIWNLKFWEILNVKKASPNLLFTCTFILVIRPRKRKILDKHCLFLFILVVQPVFVDQSTSGQFPLVTFENKPFQGSHFPHKSLGVFWNLWKLISSRLDCTANIMPLINSVTATIELAPVFDALSKKCWSPVRVDGKSKKKGPTPSTSTRYCSRCTLKLMCHERRPSVALTRSSMTNRL